VAPLVAVWRRVQVSSVQVRFSRPAEMVWIRSAIQHVGQPRSAMRPGGASSSAAGPMRGINATAEPVSPKPMTPRVRWAAIEVLAKAPWLVTRAGSHDEEQAAADNDRGGNEIDGHDEPPLKGVDERRYPDKRPAVAKGFAKRMPLGAASFKAQNGPPQDFALL
jgi:hypothetical protein